MRTVVAVRVGAEGAPRWCIEGWSATVANGIEAGLFQARARLPDLICLRVAGKRARRQVGEMLARLAVASRGAPAFVVTDEVTPELAAAATQAGALACIEAIDCDAVGTAGVARFLNGLVDAAERRASALLPALARPRAP